MAGQDSTGATLMSDEVGAVEQDQRLPEDPVIRPRLRGNADIGARFKAWLFPAVVIVLTLILTGLGWSGTSVGVLSNGSHVIAGTPRPIRSDEWNVQTPLVVAQSHHDYAETSSDSIGTHDMGVLLDVPTKTWPTIFRPWDYGFFVLDITHGYAFRWWALSAVLLLGAYSLLLHLTGRPLLAAIFSVALWASPFFHWWYADGSLASAGLAMAALAAFLAALKRDVGFERIALTAVATWALVAFALILYPPFQIPVALAMLCIGLGDLYGAFDHIKSLVRPAVLVLAPSLGVALAILLVFYLQNRTAIHLLNNTAYPGRRRDVGGVSNLYQLLSAPYGLQLANRGAGMSFTNQSEISSFVLVGPYVAVQLFRGRFATVPRRLRFACIGGFAALGLLLVWYLIGLPMPLSALTGLDHVPATRAIGGIGIAGLLGTALLSLGLSGRRLEAERDERNARPRTFSDLLGSALACAGIAFVVTFWSGTMLNVADANLGIGDRSKLAASFAVAVIVFFLAVGRPYLGGGLLAVFGIVVSLTANPLYAGLSPLTSSTDVDVFRSVPGSTSASWLSFVGPPVSDVLIASGLTTVNSVSVYPNPDAWRLLDPTQSSKESWNRYANLSFAILPAGAPTRISLIQNDLVQVGVDPCNPGLRRLGVGFLVTKAPLAAPCLAPVRSGYVAGTPVDIYRVIP